MEYIVFTTLPHSKNSINSHWLYVIVFGGLITCGLLYYQLVPLEQDARTSPNWDELLQESSISDELYFSGSYEAATSGQLVQRIN